MISKKRSIYEKAVFLVNDIFTECVDSGMSKEAAAGKTKYELDPMITSEMNRTIVYFELSHYFSRQDIKESFAIAYEKYSRGLKEYNMFDLDELKEHEEEINRKKKEIEKYKEENGL